MKETQANEAKQKLSKAKPEKLVKSSIPETRSSILSSFPDGFTIGCPVCSWNTMVKPTPEKAYRSVVAHWNGSIRRKDGVHVGQFPNPRSFYGIPESERKISSPRVEPRDELAIPTGDTIIKRTEEFIKPEVKKDIVELEKVPIKWSPEEMDYLSSVIKDKVLLDIETKAGISQRRKDRYAHDRGRSWEEVPEEEIDIIIDKQLKRLTKINLIGKMMGEEKSEDPYDVPFEKYEDKRVEELTEEVKSLRKKLEDEKEARYNDKFSMLEKKIEEMGNTRATDMQILTDTIRDLGQGYFRFLNGLTMETNPPQRERPFKGKSTILSLCPEELLED